jgi:hypothetical protein
MTDEGPGPVGKRLEELEGRLERLEHLLANLTAVQDELSWEERHRTFVADVRNGKVLGG